MHPTLLQQQQQRQAMGHRGRLARALYCSASRQLAAQGLPFGSGSRAAPAAAASLVRPSAGAATAALQDAFSSCCSFSSSSRRRPGRIGAYYSSDAPMQAPPNAYSSNGAAAGPTSAQVAAAVYDNGDAAATPTPAAVQQAPGQAPNAPVQSGPLSHVQTPGMQLPAQVQLQGAPGQPAPGQPGRLQPQPQQGMLIQPGQMQPAPQQGMSSQPGQMQPGHMSYIQQPPLYQQGAPVQFAGQQQPMQTPAGQQQGVPMQATQPGQQPAQMQAAPVQAGYMQPAAAAPLAPPMGQVPPPVTQPAAMGQMPAAGQAFTPAPPAAAQAPPAAAAAAAAAVVPETDFEEGWVNCVGLTGVVLHGPFLQQFGNTGKVKASMVLGLVARATGDPMADTPRPVLVEAWGERAQMLAQQVQTGALVFLQGHLSLDLRPQERSPTHGPALVVEADSWELVTATTVPNGRALCTYKGEYDGVLRMLGGGGGGAGGSGAYAQSSYGGQQQQGYQKPGIDRAQAMQMFLQGANVFDMARSLDCRPGDVFEVLVDAAEAQGAGSPAWAPLLSFARLAPPAKAVAYYNAVMQAVHQNRELPTKDGRVRMTPVREFLLSPQCQLAQELRQQEAGKMGVNKTYEQVRLLLAMLRAGVRL
ncbi:hypothetical protein COO60DRAFT_320550 [Scenedesmus sp. NREL 46B-D3]|nr:hypothetical protein COO60DRAFT_320550 [Scenedesmus sp. NREL 46B-D3]